MRKVSVALLVCALHVAALRAHGPAAAQAVTLEDATLHVEVLGGAGGRPLVVVNGGPGFDHSYLHACDVWSELAAARPVVFYDQRGNGGSTPFADLPSCTVADSIDDLDGVRAHLGAETIDLLGHSWGGILAMAYAARHPGRVHRLILVGSGGPAFEETDVIFDKVFPDVVAEEASFDFAAELGDAVAERQRLRAYMSMLFYTPEARDAFLARADSYVFSRAVNAAINADRRRFDLNPELPKFRFPVLVATGRFDANVAPSTAWRIHRAIPGSRFLVFERSGHIPFCEEPAAFVGAAGAFLDAP